MLILQTSGYLETSNKMSMKYTKFEKIAKKLAGSLKKIPREWDGKEAILEMKENGSRHWKQMEWMGFYFEFLCEKFLPEEGEKVSYGKVVFDGFFEVPWDYKAHAINTSSHDVVMNSREAVENAIADYGSIGIIVAIGDVEYNDEDGTFKKWHSKLKGGKSKFEKERIKRRSWSRLRKVAFSLKEIVFVRIDKKVLENAGSFQKGFRNADGKLRQEKIRINLEDLSDNDYYSVEW